MSKTIVIHILLFVVHIHTVLCETSANTSTSTTAGQEWKATGCPQAFHSRCKCGQVPFAPTGRLSYVTNCTNANFTDTDMLTQTPPQTEVLIFTGNHIRELPPNLIGLDAKYDKLHTIDLSHNHIKSIRGKCFHNVKTVRVLSLSNNDIVIDDDNFHPRIFSNFDSLEELHLSDAFDNTVHDLNFLYDLWITFNESSLTALKVLDLNDNHIRSTFPSPTMFCSLPSLQRLYLSNNYLTDFALNLTCLHDINTVDVSANLITTLNNRSLQYIESGPPNYHMNISLNTFRCDCKLIDFFLWTKTADKDVRLDSVEKYRCAYGHPMDNAGKYFDDLSALDMECVEAVRNDDFREYISISYAILTSLVLILIGLMSALLYINRQFLSNCWTYLTTGMVSKRQYTSLGQQSKRQHNQQQRHTNQDVAEVEV